MSPGMNARDELAEVIHARICEESLSDCLEYRGRCVKAAGEAVAAGYRKPRTITTVEELDALPNGSVIRTSGDEDEFYPRVAIKTGFWHNESEWFVADDSEWCLSSDELDDLPATVIYEPTA